MAMIIKIAYSNWLDKYRWDWFATLTLRPGMRRKAAVGRFADWINELEYDADSITSWARVFEVGQLDRKLHLHAVISGVRGIATERGKSVWGRLAGMAKIEIYDPSKNGLGYMLKVLEHGPEVDFDASLHQHHLKRRGAGIPEEARPRSVRIANVDLGRT